MSTITRRRSGGVSATLIFSAFAAEAEEGIDREVAPAADDADNDTALDAVATEGAEAVLATAPPMLLLPPAELVDSLPSPSSSTHRELTCILASRRLDEAVLTSSILSIARRMTSSSDIKVC